MSTNMITEWSSPEEMIDSGWGRITYREWCEKECARMNKHGGNAVIFERDDGFIAIGR